MGKILEFKESIQDDKIQEIEDFIDELLEDGVCFEKIGEILESLDEISQTLSEEPYLLSAVNSNLIPDVAS
jgi:hypothetical protein